MDKPKVQLLGNKVSLAETPLLGNKVPLAERLENIVPLIENIFQDTVLKVSNTKYGETQYKLIDESANNCITFEIRSEFIIVNYLSKCGSGSGTNWLHKMDTLARQLNKNIHLVDASRIHLCNISINLSHLNILSNGQSWYNKHGYMSETYNREILHNKKLIDKLFLSILNKYVKDETVFASIVSNLVIILNANSEIDDPYEYFEYKTIQQVFTEIKANLIMNMNNCNENLCANCNGPSCQKCKRNRATVKLLATLIEMFSKEIIYDGDSLIKYIKQ